MQELRKPSYAEICQRIREAPASQAPPHTPKDARATCGAPAGEDRKCDAVPADGGRVAEHRSTRETYSSSSSSSSSSCSSRPGSVALGRGPPPREARRPPSH